MNKILEHLIDSVAFSMGITKKFFIALFTWNFYDYKNGSIVIDFSMTIKNRLDPIRMKILIRKSKTTGIKKYKIANGFMFNNPWNNPWRDFSDEMEGFLLDDDFRRFNVVTITEND